MCHSVLVCIVCSHEGIVNFIRLAVLNLFDLSMYIDDIGYQIIYALPEDVVN